MHRKCFNVQHGNVNEKYTNKNVLNFSALFRTKPSKLCHSIVVRISITEWLVYVNI